MRILALDPGEKIGWARCETNAKGKLIDASLKHGITPLKEMIMRIADVIDSYDVIVMEDYRISAAKVNQHIGSSVPTIQFIGMVRLLVWQHPKVKLEIQMPATKSTGLKAMRKLKPAWHETCTEAVAHDDGHDQDAITHLFYWWWRTHYEGGDA